MADAKVVKSTVISENGNGLGVMVAEVLEDGTARTRHTGPRLPKPKTSYNGKGRTNVGDPPKTFRRG